MKLVYRDTPVNTRKRTNPYDNRRRCMGTVHSYVDPETGHEYRKEFLTPCEGVVPNPPPTLDSNVPLYEQVPGLITPHSSRVDWKPRVSREK